MASAPRPLIAGNWKMNGLAASAAELKAMIEGSRSLAGTDLMVCPPATLVAGFAALAKGAPVAIGGQDRPPRAAGALPGGPPAQIPGAPRARPPRRRPSP